MRFLMCWELPLTHAPEYVSGDGHAEGISGVALWLGGQAFADWFGVVGWHIAMPKGLSSLSLR